MLENSKESIKLNIHLFNFSILKIQHIKNGRTIITIFGIKLAFRPYKLSNKKIFQLNKPYEDGELFHPKVKSSSETLDALINSHCSICRYGDGEFNIIFGENISYQEYDSNLAEKLAKILKSDDENIMIGIPDVFYKLDEYEDFTQKFWRKFCVYYREIVYSLINKDKIYYDANVSRPYICVEDKAFSKPHFEKFKKLWNDKDIVFVEGEASRLGVGNDLFANAKSIERILCPAQNAFNKYEQILNTCMELSSDKLFILALGPTATVLAYDLAKAGYRAIDLGHLDIEYEWFKLGTTKKVVIKNKYTNEAKNGKIVANINDKTYLKEIYKKIL